MSEELPCGITHGELPGKCQICELREAVSDLRQRLTEAEEAMDTAIEKLSIPLDERLTLERTMEIREGLIIAKAKQRGKGGKA